MPPRVVVRVGKQKHGSVGAGAGVGAGGRAGSGGGSGSSSRSGSGNGIRSNGGDGDVREVSATELPSVSSASTAPMQPLFSVTPPLSRFDEEADGSVGRNGGAGAGTSRGSGMTERDIRLLAQAGPCLGVPGAVGGTGLVARQDLPPRRVRAGGAAPAWAPRGW